jgi:hypothetical protein
METKTDVTCIIIIISWIRIKNKTQSRSIIEKQAGYGCLKSSMGFVSNGNIEWCNSRIIISKANQLIYWWIISIKTSCNYTTNSKHTSN